MSLSVSNILSDTFAMVKARFWVLVGMYFVWLAIMVGFVIVLGMVMGGSMLAFSGAMEDPEALSGLGAGMIGVAVLFYLGYVLVICAQYAALCALSSPLRQADFGDAFSTGVRAALPLLGVMVVLLVGYFAGALAIGALAGALSTLGSAGAIIVALLVVPVLLYLGARLGVVFLVVSVDGVRNPFSAIGRAWGLTRGHALPIVLAFVVFMVIAVVLMGLAFAPFFGSIMAMDEPNAAPAMGGMIFGFVAIFAFTVVLAIAYAALLASIHGLLVGGTTAAEAFE